MSAEYSQLANVIMHVSDPKKAAHHDIEAWCLNASQINMLFLLIVVGGVRRDAAIIEHPTTWPHDPNPP